MEVEVAAVVLLLHSGFDNVETGKTTNRRVYCHGQLLCRSIGYRSFPEKRLLFHFTFREVRRRPLSTSSISPFHHVFTPSADMVTHRHFLFCTSFNSVTGLGTFDNTPSAHYHDTRSEIHLRPERGNRDQVVLTI